MAALGVENKTPRGTLSIYSARCIFDHAAADPGRSKIVPPHKSDSH